MWKIQNSQDPQQTLVKPVKIDGKSLYKGGDCFVTINPAIEDTGLVFEIGGVQIPARFEFMKTGIDGYTTILKKGNLEIRTVEHLLSALWGSGIDNAYIKLETDQIPIIDASAETYSQTIQKSGVKKQRENRKYIVFDKEARFQLSSERDRYATFKPVDKLSISATSVFNNIIGTQSFAHTWSPKNYIKDISWARSFLNSPIESNGGEVWEKIRKGLRLLPEDPRQSPVITFTETEYLTPLKAENEPVRHKLLDFYGDISLIGMRIKADIIIYKPGHNFTREIVAAISAWL